MKKSITLSLAVALLAAPALGHKQEDLEGLKSTKSCLKCDLTGADLRKANLSNADLTGAELNFADLTGTTFCNTMMPDGSVNNADC